MRINMEDTNDDYYSNVDELQINPEIVDLNTLELEKNAVTMLFSKPINCNVKTGRYFSSMICGSKFEGKERNLYVEKLEDLASRLDLLVDESVQKKKEMIQSREKE
jgi:hypothetical protein